MAWPLSEKELQQQLHPREEPESIEADRVNGWRAPNQPRKINNKRNRGYRREAFPNIEESNQDLKISSNQGNLEWQGVSYDNVEDYRKAVEASGIHTGKAGYTPGPAEAITAAYWAPKAVAAYGLDKTLEVGLGALFPDTKDAVYEQALRMFPKGRTLANVSRLSRGIYGNITDVAGNAKRVWEDGVGWIYRSVDGTVVGKTLEELWQNSQARIKGIQSMATGEGLTEVGTGMKTGGSTGGTGGGPQYVQGQLPIQRVQSLGYKEKVASLMSDFGMPNGIFDLRTYDLRKPLKIDTQRRRMLEHYLSPDFIKGRFSGFDKANRPEFAAKWADFLTAKGLHPVGDIQIHHINPLYDSIHLFDGVKFDSDEYWNIIETLIDGNARTGVIHRGEAVQNLMMTLGKGKVVDTPHGIAHKYLNSITPTFFSKAEMKLMKANPAYRLKKAKEWAVIVNKSEQVILEAHKQWSLLNPKTAGSLSFDELVDTLSKYTDQGYSKLLSSDYQLPDFNRIITQIANDKGLKGPIFQQLPKPVDLSKVTKWEKIRKEQEIADELRNMRKPKKPVNPDQTELPL